MADKKELHDPWLVAVWPGMGHVAQLAGSYLVQQLDAQAAAELSEGGSRGPGPSATQSLLRMA